MPAEAEGEPAVRAADDSPLIWAAVWVALAIVFVLATRRLVGFPYQLSWRDAFHGVGAVLPQTGWAALKVWSFWAFTTAVTAGVILRVAAEIELGDAIIGGTAGVWILAFVLGNLLGPIGLFRWWSIWAIFLAAAIWLWRNPPRVSLHRPSTGQKLAILAFVLLAVSMLPMQLASPVPPFMDVLGVPSSVQRIVAFGHYLPFDNNAYGCFGRQTQTPSLELLLAMLALATHTQLATLAVTAAMLPLAGLLIFGAYRLGRALLNDTAGGVAALLLFFTCLLRRAQGVRGTALAFVMVGIGLAFFLDRSRNRTLMALGALALGTGIAAHAIDGGLAIMVAGAGIVWWLIAGDVTRFTAGLGCLAGAVLLAAPEFPIALGKPVLPYPILPIVQIAGIVAIVFSARTLRGDAPAHPRLRALQLLNIGLAAALILFVMARYSRDEYSLYGQVLHNLPILTMLAFGGVLALVGLWVREPAAMPYAGLVVLALFLGYAGEWVRLAFSTVFASPILRSMADDTISKLWDYWCPYFLIFPAGFLFALFYDRWSKPIAFFALMVMLLYPWRLVKNPADYDSAEHSITEHWAFNLTTAAIGYWAGQENRRWMFGPRGFDLVGVLDNEIRAGRITLATHVLHITNNISPWGLVQYTVFTGIDDDPIEFEHSANNAWEAGGRVRGIDELQQALAENYPYILEQVPPPAWMKQPPDGYDEIFSRGTLRLFRRRGLTTASR
jgi:hypothetical protein